MSFVKRLILPAMILAVLLTMFWYAKDGGEHKPLHYAARGGHKKVAEVLVANGADVNAKNKFGQSVLWYAAPEVTVNNEDTLKTIRIRTSFSGYLIFVGPIIIITNILTQYTPTPRLLLQKQERMLIVL